MDPAAEYAERSARFAAERLLHARRARFVSYGRIACFAIGALLFIWAGTGGSGPYRTAALLGGVGSAVLFLGLVVYHARVDRAERWADALRRVNDESRSRVRRDWTRLPLSEPSEPPDHHYAGDLDLFGRASLFQLLGPATPPGRGLLTEWLLASGPQDERPVKVLHSEDLRLRQEAVAELAAALELRQQLAATGVLARDISALQIERFVSWAEASPWLLRRSWLLWLARLSGGATVLLIVLRAAGTLTFAAWAIPLVVNLALMAIFQLRVHNELEKAAGPDQALSQYTGLFRLVSDARFHSSALQTAQARLLADAVPAHRQMARLDRIQGFANLRYSAAIFHFPIQAITLWDFHVLAALDSWREHVGPRVRGWLDVIAEIDALSSLAGLHHDNPAWAFPSVVEDGSPVLAASALGHPLIPAATRVTNEVEVGPPGTFLLVTGSNMSGKSTLLRAIGVNVVLAQAGGSVCADAFRMPRVRLETSMRVQDSLEEGISYFMAALRRLKEIVDASRESERSALTLLFLLDEILQGTNTAERQLASRAIIQHLLHRGAIGVVTTHDLTLAEAPELASAARLVHFTETVHDVADGGGMTFDYRLRPGLATSRNALRLMRLVGLDP